MFAEMTDQLISGSWDRSARVWNIYSKREAVEVLEHGSEVVALDLSPDNKKLYTATLNGNINIWLVEEGHLFGSIECQRDIWGGRLISDKIVAKRNPKNKHFNSICLNPTGEYLLACGNSKYACVYDVSQKILLRRYTLTNNRSLDGILQKLNSSKMTENGPVDELDFEESNSEGEEEKGLPGVRKPNSVKRTTKLVIRGKCIRISKDGKSFAVVTTEGLMIFQSGLSHKYLPYKLTAEVTLSSAIDLHNSRRFVEALLVALQLDYKLLVETLYLNIPVSEASLVAKTFPCEMVLKLLSMIAEQLERKERLAANIHWIRCILQSHGEYFRNTLSVSLPYLRMLHKILTLYDDQFRKLVEDNTYMISYYIRSPSSIST